MIEVGDSYGRKITQSEDTQQTSLSTGTVADDHEFPPHHALVLLRHVDG